MAIHNSSFMIHNLHKLFALIVSALFFAGCEKKAEIGEVEWVTMGTVASFKYRDKADEAKARIVRETFAEVERLLNAHAETSELRRLAQLPDSEILEKCDAFVRPCYEAAFRFRDMSGGVFNPRWRGEHTMDLGGIAKGFALDEAARRIGICDALIDLGGNLKACGGSWRVGIYGTGEIITLTTNMASSTSGEYFRGNHIKDGRTGGDITSKAYSVTVVDPASAMTADALSTILFIIGRDNGAAFIATNFPNAKAIWK